MRIALARLLLSEPELLILDEPTNHLDAAAKRWVASYLSGYDGSVMIVSHDENLLTKATTSVAEVCGQEREQGLGGWGINTNDTLIFVSEWNMYTEPLCCFLFALCSLLSFAECAPAKERSVHQFLWICRVCGCGRRIC